MYWKRLSHALLLGVGLSVLNLGCAAVDALVSSPAGKSANRSSTQRMAAIGRVFENQGRYEQASSMYRSALRADPGNSVAKDRLQYIAQMNTKRQFKGSEDETLEAFAIADSLTTRKKTPQPRKTPVRSVTPPVEDIETVLDEASAVASLVPTTEATSMPEDPDPLEFKIPEPKTDIKIVTASTDIGDVDVVDTGWELAGMADDRPLSASWSEVGLTFPDETTGVATVGFEGNEAGYATVASMESEWKTASRRVSLDELLAWSDQPSENQSNLLLALESGDDDGVKALAALLLIECSVKQDETNQALETASRSGSDFLKVAALDALVQRGALSSGTVDGLLVLLRSVDAEIQTQAATCLRNLSGTPWATRAVAGLQALLSDDRNATVVIAATTLGDFGEGAVSSRPELIDIFEYTQDDEVRNAVGLALRRIPANSEGPTATDLPPVSATDSGSDSGVFLPVVE